MRYCPIGLPVAIALACASWTTAWAQTVQRDPLLSEPGVYVVGNVVKFATPDHRHHRWGGAHPRPHRRNSPPEERMDDGCDHDRGPR